jgi:hypothetical protein
MTSEQKRAGKKAFWWTLGLLAAVVAIYVASHTLTFLRSAPFHYEAADVMGDREKLLVTVAVLGDQLDAPTAVAAPAVEALLHDLERSVLAAETGDDVTDLFDTVAQELAKLGIRQDVGPKILETARARAIELVSASEDEQEVPRRLFQAELSLAGEWILDGLGVPASLEQVEQLQEAADQMGYGPNSKVGETLADMMQELREEQPNRQLVVERLDQVADEIRGPKSLFWSHPALRWLEVVAWSLMGILAARLWSIGKYMGTQDFQPDWNWWWWANIVQAPILAVGVVLALTYFELGLASGETLGLKISLRGQPMELTVAVSLILGLFSDRAYKFLDQLADKVLPQRESEAKPEKEPGEEEKPGSGEGGP